MLTSGMVPALFPDDEKEAILNNVRDEAQKAGVSPSKEAIWQYFVTKCANNLHIVLAMSPVGDILKTRCRNFPGLVNNTCIDWFMAWPKQALLAVASRFLEDVGFSFVWWSNCFVIFSTIFFMNEGVFTRRAY